MRLKVLAGLLLALVVGACPCLAPLASAASAEKHACCPAQQDAVGSQDCCLRAAPSGVFLPEPQFVVLGLISQTSALPIFFEVSWSGSMSLSPPDSPLLSSHACRAPPVLPA